jgi:hypothetical protein
MRQYSSLKFISLLLLLSLVFGCNTFNKKIYKKSNIVGATVDDHNASVEIREELDEKGDIIKKNYNHPYYFTAGGLTNMQREKAVIQERRITEYYTSNY